VFYREERTTYEEALHGQIAQVTAQRGKGNLQALLHAGETWEIA
jgi:2-oxoglutarate ferredoxin oxidoreductase subunit beta